jgi:hypothetical protein
MVCLVFGEYMIHRDEHLAGYRNDRSLVPASLEDPQIECIQSRVMTSCMLSCLDPYPSYSLVAILHDVAMDRLLS